MWYTEIILQRIMYHHNKQQKGGSWWRLNSEPPLHCMNSKQDALRSGIIIKHTLTTRESSKTKHRGKGSHQKALNYTLSWRFKNHSSKTLIAIAATWGITSKERKRREDEKKEKTMCADRRPGNNSQRPKLRLRTPQMVCRSNHLVGRHCATKRRSTKNPCSQLDTSTQEKGQTKNNSDKKKKSTHAGLGVQARRISLQKETHCNNNRTPPTFFLFLPFHRFCVVSS